MRLAYWANNAAEFDVARKYLTAVVDDLRPEYGFALYEIGRSYRLEKRFEDALKYFERAMKVPRWVREVGDTRIQGQIDLAKDQSAVYP